MYKLQNYILVLSLAATVWGEFPTSINKCPRDDDTCLRKTIQEVMNNYPGGLRELNLLPIDPLHVKSLSLKRNPSSPVNIELSFKELDLIGLKSARVKTLKNWNLNKRCEFEATVPEFIIKGKYAADGRVLILPVTGKGDSVITCKNIHLKYSFDIKPVEKNGKVFAELEHVKLEFKPELVHYKFDGLFNGDKTLGDNMNKFLNENWFDIYKELDGDFAEALGLIVKQVINNVLSKFPFDELFS